MSVRSRLFVCAVGLGVFSGPGLAQSPDCQGTSCKPPTETGDSSNQKDRGANPKDRFVLPVQIIQSPDDAQSSAESEHKTEEHETADLEAQRKAADAAAASAEIAEWQKIPTIAQIILAGLAAFGLFVSLYYTRQSIALSRAATEAAVAGNTATIKAIDQEQNNAQRQMRAYVTYSGFRFEKSVTSAMGYQMKFSFKNAGSTPAYNVLVKLGSGNMSKWPPYGSAPMPELDDFKDDSPGYLGPGESAESEGTYISLQDIVRADAAREATTLAADVRYTDAFGIKRKYLICVGIFFRGSEFELMKWPENPSGFLEIVMVGPHNGGD